MPLGFVHILKVVFMLQKVADAIDALNEWVGNKVAWLSLAMAVVMFLTVILRYVFDMGWIWMQESVVYMHGILFMVAAGFTLKHEQHVRIDIIYDRLSQRKKAVINLLGTVFFLLPTCFAIFYYAYPYVSDSWAVQEGSKEAGGIPGVFLLKSAILIFPTLVGLQGLAKAIRAVLTLTNSDETPTTP